MDASLATDRSSPLFHVGIRGLAVGEILRPYAIGDECGALIWRVVRALDGGVDAIREILAGTDGSWPRGPEGCPPEMVLLEAVFERVRTRVAPESPNRLDAVFAWRGLPLARRFRDQYAPDRVVYRCVVVAGTAIERDGGLVVEAYESADLAQPSAEHLRRVEERAARYWRPVPPLAFPEMLVHGTVAVEAVVDPEPADRRGERWR